MSRLDPNELRRHMRLALDVVMAHRIVRKLSLDRERVTAIREIIEERVTLALGETDESHAPGLVLAEGRGDDLQPNCPGYHPGQKNEPPGPGECA